MIWFDDVELRRIGDANCEVVNEPRASASRTLLFSPVNVNYLRVTAGWWAQRGIRGFMFDKIMEDWRTDVWATDGNPATRDQSDQLLREVRACNEECLRYGIDSNFVKVALYTAPPDWFGDEEDWQTILGNFRQAARFAKLSKSAGVAIDTEYIADRYELDWPGYSKAARSTTALKAQVRKRWFDIVSAMLQEFPALVLLIMPEGLQFGALHRDLLAGAVEALAAARAPGGVHILSEETYHLTDPAALATFPLRIDVEMRIALQSEVAATDYWRTSCSVAMGAWPLGYYRALTGADGKPAGFGGRSEVFGDAPIGSYGDKGPWYSPAEFGQQMAALRTFSPRYNWIYAHGSVFWTMTTDEMKEYARFVHHPASNDALPTVPNIAEYLDAVAASRRIGPSCSTQ